MKQQQLLTLNAHHHGNELVGSVASMQAHRHFNELDHWRNTSQRLNTSSPSDSAPPPLSTLDISQEEPRDRQHDGEPSAPLNEQTAMEDNEARNSSSDLFPIESSRGWLEYAPVEIAPTASKSLDRNRASERGGDDMSTNFGSRVQHMHSELPTTSDSQKGAYCFLHSLQLPY